MTYSIPDENARIPVTLEYIADQIAEIDRRLHDYDYYEDPAGNLVYSPAFYQDEKDELKPQKAVLQKIQEMLTGNRPFHTGRDMRLRETRGYEFRVLLLNKSTICSNCQY